MKIICWLADWLVLNYKYPHSLSENCLLCKICCQKKSGRGRSGGKEWV